MADLWTSTRQRRREAVEPLAVRLRPRTFEEFVGQRHILGPGRLLTRMIEADRLTSILLSGPPGTGKTTLAEVIARHTGSRFEAANAASIGVREIRRILEEAKQALEDEERRTILFLDEIHRFARNQQDVLLESVERGLVTLVGATTENPYFAINSALVSRSTVFRLDPLEESDIAEIVRRAIGGPRAFGDRRVVVDDEAVSHWARASDGDARRALTALEVAVLSQPPGDPVRVDLACAEASIQAKALVYDGTGDEHYDVISAFIKSMRGGDPDATVYWLARMLEAGEDPRFIARRIAILASEDIGNADPQALPLAAAAWTVTERVGLPECRLTLAHAAIYMACAPKSDACTKAIAAASDDVRAGRTVAVPAHLRDRTARLHSGGAAYRNPHDDPEGAGEQSYLDGGRRYYRPLARGFEDLLRARLEETRGGEPPSAASPEPAAGPKRTSRRGARLDDDGRQSPGDVSDE